MKRIAIYYRVSTDMQELTSQKHEIELWLAAQKIVPEVVHKIEDYAVSGKRADRVGFKKLMSLAKRGKIDGIIVYRLDRFSRDASTAIRQIMDLEALGVAFVSVTQPILDLRSNMPFKRTILTIFAELAEMERDTIVQRVKSGMAAAKARGMKFGQPVKVTEAIKEEIIAMRKSGFTYRLIASRLSLSIGAVHKAYVNASLSNDNDSLG